jgi:low temperature requirement protein LtrA
LNAEAGPARPGKATSPLRPRGAGAHARVAFVELFFDLVFVFAITQLSHALLHDMTVAGALRTAVLFLAVWWSWINTAWVTNWIEPDTLPGRGLLFALMLCGLLLAIAIPDAFGALGPLFALAHVAMECGRSAFMARLVGDHDPALRRNFQRILCWQLAAAPFWLAGALAEGHWRLGLWAVALAVWTAAPFLGFRVPGSLGASTTRDWTVDGPHLAERCGLFVIIALGESILVTGATFGDLAWTPATIGAFVVAFAGSVAMWWVYFHIGAERGTRHIGGASDPGRVARLGYTYLHIPVVAGIVLAAVGDERILHHPQGAATPADAVAILGGPALYLAGLALFKRMSAGRLPLSHLLGLALLAVLGVAVPLLSPLGLAALAAACLVLVAVWEHLSLSGFWRGRRAA